MGGLQDIAIGSMSLSGRPSVIRGVQGTAIGTMFFSDFTTIIEICPILLLIL